MMTVPAPALGVADRVDQRLLALRVEIGVRLVEDQHRRVAVERPGQRDPLPLAAREPLAAGADLGVIAARQAEQQVVRAGPLGG